MRQFAVLLVLCALVSAKDKERVYAPLPKKISEAKTVYIDNQTGNPHMADLAYQGMKEWGRYKTVDSTEHPDLIIRLRITGSEPAPARTPDSPQPAQNNTTVVVNSSNVTVRQPYDFNAHVKPLTLPDPPAGWRIYYVNMDVINPEDSVVLFSAVSESNSSNNPKKSGTYRCLYEWWVRMPENQKEKK